MTAVIAINAVLAIVVFAVIIGLKIWAVHSARPSVAAPVPAHNPRVREHAARARAAHADRARAARSFSGPAGARA
jgi:hypothetical protein